MRYGSLLLSCIALSACSENLKLYDANLNPYQEKRLPWSLRFNGGATSDSLSPIKIRNRGAAPASFSIIFNNTDLTSIQSILNQVRKISPNENQLHIAAWKFVSNLSQHYAPLSGRHWLHHPLIFLNSAGFGLCDDRASVLFEIWAHLGYETRIWGLNGHVVPEVYAEGKWQLLDPDYAVYYRNADGEIASVAEIAQDPSLIWKPYEKLDGTLQGAYSYNLSSLYSSIDDNKACSSSESHCGTKSRLDDSVLFTIPPDSTLDFMHKPKKPLSFDPNVEPIPNFQTAILEVPPNTSAWTTIPLIPFHVAGDGHIWNGSKFLAVGTKLTKYFSKRTDFNPSFKVSTDRGMQIHFSLNPHLLETSEEISIEIRTDQPGNLEVTDQAGNPVSAFEIRSEAQR